MDHDISGFPSSLLWIFLLLFGLCLPSHAEQPGVAHVVDRALHEPTAWYMRNNNTHIYNFNVTWVRINSDKSDFKGDGDGDSATGYLRRPVIGINGKWPLPVIKATVGDRIVINLLNLLEDQPTSLHFHGLELRNKTHMDGPVHVSQCAIPPGSRFTYNFTVTQPGVYWYHSHVHGQYPDGLRGPLIVHDPHDPFREKYNETQLLTVSDWYQTNMPELIQKFMSKTNPSGAEPVPDTGFFNDNPSTVISVKPNTTYRFDMINMGAFANVYIWFEGHNMTVIMIDGVYTQLVETNMIYVTPGQRYSFLVTTKADTSANFPFVASMDLNLFDKPARSFYPNITGWLVYDEKKDLPMAEILNGAFNPVDDYISLVPLDDQLLLGEPDQVVQLDVMMDNLGDGANYAFFNNVTYVRPKVPTLYTVMSSKDLATNPAIYGTHTHTILLRKNDIVQIVLNNFDPGIHPFHFHGHNFQVVWRSEPEAGPFQDSNVPSSRFAPVPMRRDTVVVHPNGNLVLRFKADNPGVWLFHCHIEWHVQSGLMATFVEAPLEIQQSLTIPPDHLAVCKDMDIPTEGNAAGHTDDFLNLNGENAPPNRLPDGYVASLEPDVCHINSDSGSDSEYEWNGYPVLGWEETEKDDDGLIWDGEGSSFWADHGNNIFWLQHRYTSPGIVALVFSCLTGLLGVITIAWYGLAEGVKAKKVRIEGQQDGTGDVELTDIRTDSTLVDEERVDELCRGGINTKATGEGVRV